MIHAISPIDGRYEKETRETAKYFDEAALIGYRTFVEIEYIKALSNSGITRILTDTEINGLGNICSSINAERVKEIEEPINHDVKAVEYYIGERLRDTSLGDMINWIHFALTSEDVNNISYAFMISDGTEKIILPNLESLNQSLEKLAHNYKNLPMLSRTHNQPASPTTFGKEMNVFSYRIRRQLDNLYKQKLTAKLNGATGNYNAHYAAFPDFDWMKFSEDFIYSFNKGRKILLEPNLVTTQIDSMDSYVELFNTVHLTNKIIIGLDQDMWRYAGDEWIKIKPKKEEVGSSTMPHKVNPIRFENSEGNLETANKLLELFADTLPVSRLQRDLSNSTIRRNIGMAFDYSLLGYKSARKGIEGISVNEEKIIEDLNKHPEVISEGIQTILRREGIPEAYEKLKELTRGREIKIEDFRTFIDGLKVNDNVKDELRKLTPENYIGIADKLAII